MSEDQVVFIAHTDHVVFLLRIVGGGLALRCIEGIFHVVGCNLIRRLLGAGALFVNLMSTHTFLQDCIGRSAMGCWTRSG